jgi:hypothetical protein
MGCVASDQSVLQAYVENQWQRRHHPLEINGRRSGKVREYDRRQGEIRNELAEDFAVMVGNDGALLEQRINATSTKTDWSR